MGKAKVLDWLSDWPVSSAAGDIGPKVPEGFGAK
jgi:hypothetical protein